jgi:hypothetical protein
VLAVYGDSRVVTLSFHSCDIAVEQRIQLGLLTHLCEGNATRAADRNVFSGEKEEGWPGIAKPRALESFAIGPVIHGTVKTIDHFSKGVPFGLVGVFDFSPTEQIVSYVP